MLKVMADLTIKARLFVLSTEVEKFIEKVRAA